jgi:hypothetical protein
MATENALTDKVNEAQEAAPITEETQDGVVATQEPAQEPEVEETPEERSTREHSERVQKRINSEVGRRKQAEAKAHRAELAAAEARGKAEALEAARTAQATPTPEPVKPPGGRESFDSDDDWLKAHREYDARQLTESFQRKLDENAGNLTKQYEKDLQDREAREAERKAVKGFTESVANSRSKHTDYDDVVTNPNLVISEDVVNVLQMSEIGGEIAYHLGQNPDEAAHLSSLPPLAIAKEIGKIEARLVEPPKKRVSTAPDPLKPIVPGGEVPHKDPDKMSQAEYEQWRQGS